MIDELMRDTEQRMQKCLEALQRALGRIRTGRAHPSLLESLKVSCYGAELPLQQAAKVSASDARTLMITPFDKANLAAIEKAVREADLGLNPTTSGEVIHVLLPPLTEERRRQLTRLARNETEQARVSLRNIRRDAIKDIKEMQSEGMISEDDDHRGEQQLQKLTDRYVGEVETLLAAKEKGLLEV